MKMTPNSPKCQLIAACSRSMPSRPEILSAGTSSMIMAVQVQRSVSMKTPIACISPTLAGWEVSAVAAAHGAEPLPASLEKSPFDTVHQYGAEAACDCLAQTECFLKNAGKNAWKLAEVHDN